MSRSSQRMVQKRSMGEMIQNQMENGANMNGYSQSYEAYDHSFDGTTVKQVLENVNISEALQGTRLNPTGMSPNGISPNALSKKPKFTPQAKQGSELASKLWENLTDRKLFSVHKRRKENEVLLIMIRDKKEKLFRSVNPTITPEEQAFYWQEIYEECLRQGHSWTKEKDRKGRNRDVDFLRRAKWNQLRTGTMIKIDRARQSNSALALTEVDKLVLEILGNSKGEEDDEYPSTNTGYDYEYDMQEQEQSQFGELQDGWIKEEPQEQPLESFIQNPQTNSSSSTPKGSSYSGDVAYNGPIYNEPNQVHPSSLGSKESSYPQQNQHQSNLAQELNYQPQNHGSQAVTPKARYQPQTNANGAQKLPQVDTEKEEQSRLKLKYHLMQYRSAKLMEEIQRRKIYKICSELCITDEEAQHMIDDFQGPDLMI